MKLLNAFLLGVNQSRFAPAPAGSWRANKTQARSMREPQAFGRPHPRFDEAALLATPLQ